MQPSLKCHHFTFMFMSLKKHVWISVITSEGKSKFHAEVSDAVKHSLGTRSWAAIIASQLELFVVVTQVTNRFARS
jgi:hypothetical protein